MSAPPELEIGAAAPRVTVGPLRLTDVVRYAGASGDFNPIHHDPDLARSLGHRDVFVMGMLPGAMLGAYAAEWLAPLRVRTLDLRFVDRVWTDEQLECGGEVVDVDRAGQDLVVTAKLWVRVVDGGVKVSGACTATPAGAPPGLNGRE
jgi:acyl dehydratase